MAWHAKDYIYILSLVYSSINQFLSEINNMLLY